MSTAAQQNSSLSSLSSHFPLAKLSSAQSDVVTALAQGLTVSAVARQAGLLRTTIHHWLRTSSEFKAAVENARCEYAATLSDEMHDLSAMALKSLRNLLESPETPAAVRLNTALAVLERPHSPNPGWHLPERIESAREHQVPETLPGMKAEESAMRMANAVDANARRPEPVLAGTVARSAPCPCGSGRKYKRCCGIASPARLRGLRFGANT
jgi:transposase-like protein